MITVRRILLAVDASPTSLAAARTAIDLAVRSAAELEVVFVDEHRPPSFVHVLRASAGSAEGRRAPGDPASSGVRPGDRTAREVRRRIERLAAGRVRFTFRRLEGRAEEEIPRTAPRADLVVLGRVGWSRRRSGGLGSTAAAVISRGVGLVIPESAPSADVLVVVYGPSVGGPSASEAAGSDEPGA